MAGVKDPFQRLKKLSESRLNLEMKILEMLDQISCIKHEQDEIARSLGAVGYYRGK